MSDRISAWKDVAKAWRDSETVESARIFLKVLRMFSDIHGERVE
jgi:hypothetical protein